MMQRVIQMLTISVLALATLAWASQSSLQPASLPEPATMPVPGNTSQATATIDSEHEPEYLKWFIRIEKRILDLFGRNKTWTNLAISAYPNVPTAVLQDGRLLRDDWAALVVEIDAWEPPDKYTDFHSEFAAVVRLAADSTDLLYSSFRSGDMNKAGEAVVLQSRAEAALSHAFDVVLDQPGPASLPATSTPTVTPQEITAVVIAQDLSVRAGPGHEYLRLDAVTRGTKLVLTGRNESGSWVRGRAAGQGLQGWLSAESIEIGGDTMALPVVEAGQPSESRATPTTSPPTTTGIRISVPAFLNRSYLSRPYCVGGRCTSLGTIGMVILVLVLALALAARGLGGGDTEPPNIVSFDFEPKVVSTAAGDQTITFTVRITDDRSGVGDPGSDGTTYGNFAQFRSSSGRQQAHVAFTRRDRVAGNGRDGTYVSTMTLARHSEVGVWKLSYLEIQDNVGNGRTISLDEMARLGFPTAFQVESVPQPNSDDGV
ncbi:MAG: hypothetical protein ACE5LU_26220, partial [Anaerolineae bacterium]